MDIRLRHYARWVLGGLEGRGLKAWAWVREGGGWKALTPFFPLFSTEESFFFSFFYSGFGRSGKKGKDNREVRILKPPLTPKQEKGPPWFWEKG